MTETGVGRPRLRDDVRTATDMLRAIVRRRARLRGGSLTRLANDTGIPVADLLSFADGAPVPVSMLQALCRQVLHGRAEYDARDDTLWTRGRITKPRWGKPSWRNWNE